MRLSGGHRIGASSTISGVSEKKPLQSLQRRQHEKKETVQEARTRNHGNDRRSYIFYGLIDKVIFRFMFYPNVRVTVFTTGYSGRYDDEI